MIPAMAKKKDPIDARKILNQGYHFAKANLAPRSMKPAKEIASPSMVLSAFAIELLLKCILVIENGDAPETHRLNVLFRRVSHKTKRRIEALWDEKARQRIAPFCKAEGLPHDLPNAFVKCATAFERIRYIHEGAAGVAFYLGDLPKLLIQVIGELRP